MYPQAQQTGKPNDQTIFASNKTKHDSQNWPNPSDHEEGERREIIHITLRVIPLPVRHLLEEYIIHIIMFTYVLHFLHPSEFFFFGRKKSLCRFCFFEKWISEKNEYIDGGLLVPLGIIHPVVSASALTWFIRYIYYWNLPFLNSVIIIKTRAHPLINW
jgi:hypothetical protein